MHIYVLLILMTKSMYVGFRAVANIFDDSDDKTIKFLLQFFVYTFCKKFVLQY